MLRKILKQIKLIFSSYPRRHLYLLLVGIIFLISMTLFSNIKIDSNSPKEALFSQVSMEELDLESAVEAETSNFIKLKRAEIKRNDSLFSILKRLGIEEKNIVTLVNSDRSNLLAQIKIGKTLEVGISDFNKVISLNYIKDFKSGVRAKKSGEVYEIEEYELNTEKYRVFKNIEINNSLYVDGLKEGLPDSVIMDLVYIFGWDIDFVHDIRPGDSYSLIYEEVFVNGEKKLDGDILIAEFINRDRTHTAIRYKLQNGFSEYFSLEGRNVKKAFLRSPVKFSYISSSYNLKRRHPILHKIRAHTGVDYAASRGTPVRTTGDGTVVFADKKGGYGNLVEIKHTEDYSTRYAHLNKFHSKIKVGGKVKQSETIGYVGRTGTATGDHLHYEFRVNGKHTNPLTVKLPNAKPIHENDKDSYGLYAEKILADLKNYQNLSF
ncbi:MAG TPA: peptidase M23 [Gammaproteobacteria bacterium]|nr:peptidase M23 [Gammaproteobacteria bacterium]HIB75430.1 peptidase M23 [Gammaproteobacteria bacterium]HIO04906.1 peptidase M23 [Gammaproteobacteria bacterium]